MRMKGFNSLAVRLTLLLFFVAATSVIVALLIFYTAYSDRLYQSHVDELRLMRDNRVQHLRSWVAEKKANFQYWHGVLLASLRDGTWAGMESGDIQQHMEAFCRAHNDVRGLILIDATTGKILQSTVNGLAAGMDGSTQPEFSAVRKTRAFSVSNIHVGPVLRELSFSVSQPYFKEDNPESELWVVLIMRIELSAWRSFFVDSLYGGRSTEVGILDENLNSLNPDHWKGAMVQKLNLRKGGLAYRAWSKKDTDVAQGINYKGVAVLGAYTYMPELKWIFIVNRDLAEIYAVRNDLLRRVLLWVPVMIGVVWLLAAWAANQIVRATKTICGVMEAFKNGDLLARTHARRPDEFGHIARMFDETADRVVALMEQLENEQRSLEREIAARTAETRLQAHAMDNTAEGVMICNHEIRIVYVNAAYERMCGYSRAEMLGQQPHQFIGGDSDQAEGRQRDIATLLETERGWCGQFSCVRKDGTSYIRETSVTAIRDQQQAIQYYVALSRDVTREVQRQKDLVMLSNAMMQSTDCTIIVTLDGGIVYVNHAYEVISGYTREEVLGKTLFETNAGHGIDHHLNEAAGVVSQGHVWHKVYTNMRKDGSSYIEEDVVSPVRNKEGEITHCVVCARDITCEVQRIDAFKEKNNQVLRLAHVVEYMQSGIQMMDTSFRIFYANPAFYQISGTCAEDVLGQTPAEACPFLFYADTTALFLRCLEKGEIWGGEMTCKRADGSPLVLYVHVSPVFDSTPVVQGYVAIFQDITHDKQLEQQLMHSQRLDTLGRLTGGIVHDFNNMLQGILGFAELLGDELPLVPNMRGNLQEIIKCAHRARELTQQLLAFGRRSTEQREVLNVNVQIEELKSFLIRVLGPAVTIELDLDSQLRTTFADRAQISQVIMNLVLNARDAVSTCATKWIGVRTRTVVFTETQCQGRWVAPPGAYVCLSVSDKGAGISKENVAKIFEPFFTTKGEGNGTGLGLSVVVGIVELSGGWIAVETEENRGTTFHVYLPVYEEGGEHVAVKSCVKAHGHTAGGHGELILYVEHEDPVRLLNARILTTAGYRLFTAPSVDEAVAAFQENREAIQLVFFDVLHAGDHGVALVSRLRRENPQLPILLCSGLAISKLIGFSHHDDLCMFLQKPFSNSQLLTAIRVLLDRARV